MVRSFAVARRPVRVVAAIALLFHLGGALQAQAPASIAPFLDQLIERGADLAPGTYVVTPDGIQPDPTARPLVLQADVLRGAPGAIRTAIALGTDLPGPFEALIRAVPATAVPGLQGSGAEARGQGQPGKVRFVRELALSPGAYEIRAVIALARPEGGAVATLGKSSLVVPDVWRGPLAATPIVLGDEVATTRERAQPFAFEPTLLTPAAGVQFARSGRLHAAFRVFNWTPGEDATPDLAVEYVFHELTPRGARFFNKMKPQRLSANALGSALDVSDGAVTAGVSLPLVSFPFGEFEMTARVTDNRSRQTVQRKVGFTVVP